jgi:hypothetical protein
MKTLRLCFIFILISSSILAQPDPSEAQKQKALVIKKVDSSLMEKGPLNFAVPDVPAFKLLGADPSNILRPSNTKELAVVFGNYIKETGGSIIPKNIAAEIAPGLLINRWYTMSEYRTKPGIRFLTKTRVSFGSAENPETGGTNIGVGLRTTLLDKGDFRKDLAFMYDSIISKMAPTVALHNRASAILIEAMGIAAFGALTETQRTFMLDSVARTLGDPDQVNIVLKDVIEKYKKDNWNATRIDFAYAFLLGSPDTTIKSIQLSKHSFWTTFAIKPGKNNNWSQILLGLNSTIFNFEGNAYNEFTGNFRFYAGGNKFKGLLELQYQNKDAPKTDRTETLFTQVGLEAAVYKGAWLHFGTGVMDALKGNARAQLVSNISLYLTFPEDFHLW